MINSFGCKETEKIWNREFSTRFSKDIQKKARRKLIMLDAALTPIDLQIPPSNRLEKLKGDRKGYYSIQINDQWRICFYFKNREVSGVEIIDYY